MTFGQSPYRACWYGEPSNGPALAEVNPHSSDELILSAVLESLKQGQFSTVERLLPYLSHPSYDVRQYAHQLFSHVCNNDQVDCLATAIPLISDVEELLRLIVRLGETFSVNALPILKSLNDEYGDEGEVSEHILLSLRLLGRPATMANVPIETECISETIEILRQEMSPSCYYYRGQPIFIGDVTKELVAAAMVANRENRAVVLVRQHVVLSNFTGVLCPIQNGQAVTDSEMDATFSYVEQAAKRQWRKGEKYFFGHEI